MRGNINVTIWVIAMLSCRNLMTSAVAAALVAVVFAALMAPASSAAALENERDTAAVQGTGEGAVVTTVASEGNHVAAKMKPAKKKLSKTAKARAARKKRGKPRIAVVNLSSSGSGGAIGWLRRSGCTPVLVTRKGKLKTSKFDGLVIPGGPDVNPKLYHAKRNPHTYGVNSKRDRLQIAAIKRFAKAGKPVLGICRGNQVLNVAFGGSLMQHIPGWHSGRRTVLIAKGTWLRKALGRMESVTHAHHQCIQRIAEGFIATQWDVRDGRIEAIEHESLPVYGLQWHPEGGSAGAKVGKLFRKECLKRM